MQHIWYCFGTRSDRLPSALFNSTPFIALVYFFRRVGSGGGGIYVIKWFFSIDVAQIIFK